MFKGTLEMVQSNEPVEEIAAAKAAGKCGDCYACCAGYHEQCKGPDYDWSQSGEPEYDRFNTPADVITKQINDFEYDSGPRVLNAGELVYKHVQMCWLYGARDKEQMLTSYQKYCKHGNMSHIDLVISKIGEHITLSKES